MSLGRKLMEQERLGIVRDFRDKNLQFTDKIRNSAELSPSFYPYGYRDLETEKEYLSQDIHKIGIDELQLFQLGGLCNLSEIEAAECIAYVICQKLSNYSKEKEVFLWIPLSHILLEISAEAWEKGELQIINQENKDKSEYFLIRQLMYWLNTNKPLPFEGW